MRLKLAENFRRDEDYWLAEQVILTCFDNLGDHVMGVPLENRPVLSELFLSTAFLLYIQHQTGNLVTNIIITDYFLNDYASFRV